MKPGFMLYSLGRSLADGSLAVPGALQFMKELGAEGVDITAWHVDQYTNAQVRQLVADAGLVTSCYIGGTSLTMDAGPERRAALDTARKIMDDSAEVGAQIVLLTAGSCAPGQDKAEGRRNVAAGLAQLLPHARANGCILTIEDFGASSAAYQTAAECLECCELAGPDMMLTYDTGNMVMGDENPVDFLEVVKARVAHAHAKDWRRLPSDAEQGLRSRAGKKYIGTVVGQGILNYPRIIAALKAIGYAGFLAFEYEGEQDPMEAAREGMAYLKTVMSSEGDGR